MTFVFVFRMSCMTASVETLRATGRRSTLPMLPRTAFHANGFADSPATMMPVTPPASATRISAPRLPGSWTSMTTSANRRACSRMASTVVGWRCTIATMPLGVRTGLMAAKV